MLPGPARQRAAPLGKPDDLPETVYLPPPPARASPAELDQWERAWLDANPVLAERAEQVSRQHRERSRRFNRLVRRLLAVFRAYHCQPADWRLLAVRIAERSGATDRLLLAASGALNGGVVAEGFWREAALSLIFEAEHVTVAPIDHKPEPRKADEHLEIDLRMEAMLSGNPETGAPAVCASIAEAARLVHREMMLQAERNREAGFACSDPPAARAIEKDYHRRKRGGGGRIPGHVRQSAFGHRVLADLERAAVAVERRANSRPKR